MNIIILSYMVLLYPIYTEKYALAGLSAAIISTASAVLFVLCQLANASMLAH